MSAESSGSSKSKDGLSLEQTSSPAPETDEVTGGKVDNVCNNQAHSTTHCTQSQTNHTPILAHAQSTEGTNQVGTSCLDGLAKEGKQKDDLTSMTEEVSNSQQRHIEQSSHFEKICVIQSVNNEDSESSTESDDQSYELRLKAKEENQDKTFVIIYRRSENDPGDQSVEAVQVAKKVNHDNQRDTSDTTRRPKGNEQKGNDSGAIPRVRGVKLEQNNGCKVTDIYKRISENENDNDDEAMQKVEDGKHNQNNEFKDSAKRPSGNDIDDDGAMQSVEDGKLEQKYGNKNTEERPSGNEKDHDNRTKPSVKNENNGDNDIEKRPFKYEKNDKGNMKTKVVKEESPDINMKTNDTERESRENEKKYHPDNATQSALIKNRQRSEKSLKDNGSEQSQNEMSGNTNNDGEWTEGKKGRDKRRPTCKSGDPDMNPSNVNTDGTDSTISEQDDNGAMPGAVMLPIDNSRDSSVMKNKGLGRIAVTATDQESQTDFGKLEKELGETDNVENKGNDQEDETNLISQAGISEISDNTTSVLGYPAKNFDDNDGGNKEIKGKGALAKTTPNTQTDSQNENPPYRQDEAGAISSEPSREALSFSQRLDDDTLLDKQLDEFIDNISTGFNENREEWKKSTRKKMKSFLLTKVMDGTFSQRSFDSCVTNNMPVQNFDSDNHITDVRGVKREQGAKGGPSSSQHSQANDPIKCTTESDAEIPYIDSEENRQGPPELSTPQTEGTKSLHGKTSSTPNPEARKPPLSQSSSTNISAETKDVRGARREQDAKDGPSSYPHNQANDPTDPSKCTAAPDVEIPFIGSPENRQGPPEQSTPQTKGAISLHGKTSRAPNPKAGDSHFSKSYSSTESSSQAGKQDTTAIHLNRSLSAASSSRFSSGHELLSIQWNMEQETKWIEPFELSLYEGSRMKYVIQITCIPKDFYRLKFMFCNTITTEYLSKSLLELDCNLKSGTNEVLLGSKILGDKSEIIRDKIEGVISNVKATSNIQVYCAETNFSEEKLVEKCKELSSEYRRGNIAVYEKGKSVWIVGRNTDDLENLEKKLTLENVLHKTSKISKDNLHITLGGREKKIGPIEIGSSKELRTFDIYCRKEDFYKLFLIFDGAFLMKNGAKFRSRGKFPSITILIRSSHKRGVFDWVDLALQDVEHFANKMLPTITAKSQKLRKNAESLIDSCKKCKKKVLELYNENVQVYSDADDSECLWFVSEDSQLVEKSLGLLDDDDLFEKRNSTPSSYDHPNPRLMTYPLSSLELGICMEFKIESALKIKYGKKIPEIFTDESKSELMISIKSIDDSIIKKEIEKLLDEKKATRSTVKKIPQCCINFLEMPDIRKEIGTEISYVIDVQNERCEAEVYSDTQGHAREVVSIIEDLFQRKKVVFEDFVTDSLILKTKVEEWIKEFSPMVKIELGSNHIKVWGLRKSVQLILHQLDSYIHQNKNASSSELNVGDEPVPASEQSFEGHIFIYKKEEVTHVLTPAFKEKVTEIQAKHKCSIKIEEENAFPLMTETQTGWRWHFLDGKSVYFNKTEMLNVKVNKTKCIVAFLQETDQSKQGVNILPGKKNVIWATVTLPTWRDGADKEKEQLRNCIQHLLQSLRDNNISSVTIPLMVESNIQWPERQFLKQILYWRRLFIDRIVFCHPNEEIYKKLLPVFQELTDKPKEEKICIRIENKSFTHMKVQILVNTVGSDLKLNQGFVSKSILQAAGKEIQNEANKKFPNGLLGGKVLVTDAYNLRDKGIQKVFHGSLLWWKENENIADIKTFVAKCLHLATEYGMASIAFPALGTGNLGYDHSAVATAMFETVRSFIEGSVYTSLKEVLFNVFDEKSKEAFSTENKKYMDKPCISGTFLPRICRFANNDLTFELYCGEVWTQNTRGLIVLYESNEILHQEEKVCIAECGKRAKCFGGQFTENQLKQTLQSKKLHMIKNKVGRPVDWIFYMTWRSGCELESALFALNCAEEENLDSVAFVISKKDGVAGKLPDIMRSIFAASKQIKKDSPLRRVILVVDPALSSAAYKTAEDHIPELIDIQKKRYQLWFVCNTHSGLQSAKAEVMSALEHLRNTASSLPLYDETKIVEPQDNRTGKDYSEKHVQNEDEKILSHQRNQEKNSTLKITSEKCSLILRIGSEQLLERGEDFIRQRLQKDVSELKVPVKIIFPFLKEGDALLKFQTHDDLVEFKQNFQHDDLLLQDRPVQAVTCVNATVSKTARTKLLEQRWTENDISERSGVELKSENDILVLGGSLPEIQAAREFLKIACFQCKPAAREKETSKVFENESLDFVNVLDKQESKNKDLQYENEFSCSVQDKSKFIKEALKENKDGEDFKGGYTNPESRLFDERNNKSANQASPSGFLANSVNVQEPGDQSIRQKERIFFSHFDYAILENLFPLQLDVTTKVHISKTDRAHVEIVGMYDSIQPFIDAKSRIQGLTKIPLDVNKKTVDQVEMNLKTYQAEVRSRFPNVYILIHEGKIHLISTEHAPDLVSNVFSILTSKLTDRKEDKKGLRIPDSGSNLKGESPTQLPACAQETFGNPVLKKKGTRVFVIHGDVFSLDVFDCLVNPTNESLDLKKNGGLSAAVHIKAGEDVQRECFKFINDNGKLQVGNCFSTTAGNLKYRRIIHTTVRPWKSFKLSKDRCQEAMDHIKDVVFKCLKLASTLKIKSIVFPAIGSGQSSIPPIVLAYGYRLGCETFLKEKTHLSEIFFAINKVDFLSLVEMTCRSTIPWGSFLSENDEYTYNMSILCKVVVAKRDVLQERNVDALVVLEDPLMHGEERIAKHVLQSRCRVYKSNREKLMKREHPPGSAEACEYRGSLKYKSIVHIYMPDCKQWKDEDVLNYKTCISNALTSLKETNNSIAMDLSFGDTKSKPVIRYYAKALTEAVIEHITSKGSTLQKIFILNANPVCHGLVTEEFSRFLLSMCNANAYFEDAVFVNCGGGVMKTIESQI